MLRLPMTVATVFAEWLERARPGMAARVESRVRSVRGGRLNDPDFGSRMRGTGEIAEQPLAGRIVTDQRIPLKPDTERHQRPSAVPDQAA